MAMVKIRQSNDSEWAEGDEVVVWTNGGASLEDSQADLTRSHCATATARPASVHVTAAGSQTRQDRSRGLRIAALANLAISYNVVNIGLALAIMADLHKDAVCNESAVKTAAILGMICGQVMFGALGDFLGRQLALCCTLLVCFVGAMGSSLLTFNGPAIYQQLLFWRILLGIGAGGVYPLAATLARSTGAHLRKSSVWGNSAGGGDQADSGSTAVALVFSMQGVGYFAARIVGFVLLYIFPDKVAWRLLLGVGAVLPLVLVVMLASTLVHAKAYGRVPTMQKEPPEGESEEVVPQSLPDKGPSTVRLWASMRDKRQLLPKLVGTAGSWFLFDVVFYGNQLYRDNVLEAVFGVHGVETPISEAAQDSVVALVALPGYFVAVALVHRMGPRRIQVLGFGMMAVLFAVLGIFFNPLKKSAVVLMILYCLTFFFSNFGPNSTTFMLPALTFPDQVRGSLNGVSAAAGKAGALMGSLMFDTAKVYLGGVGPVLIICALFSLAGGALTMAFVHPDEEDKPTLVVSGDETEGDEQDTVELAGTTPTSRDFMGLKSNRKRGYSSSGSDSTGGRPLSPGEAREHTPIKITYKGLYTRVQALGEMVQEGEESSEGDVSVSGRGVLVGGTQV